MDRSRPAAGRARARIPRTRGGWTADGGPGVETPVGFPAPAGMDPRYPCSRRRRPRIPRTRGDGPACAATAVSARTDSPHPRGWTLYDRFPPPMPDGFPAPAGMDPRISPRPAAPRRIPRTRGDGPTTQPSGKGTQADSPHPRGWTVDALRRQADDLGFPAPAGMDPGRAAAHVGDRRIPRTRGDGPVLAHQWRSALADSPHPRGWTRRARQRAESGAGFPAPAGMDRLLLVASLVLFRIPRTRGDGPMRGKSAAAGRSDSPHPRGWTRAAGSAGREGRGFPAPAGMDHAAPRPSRWRARIPRTRGDGPDVPADAEGAAGDSPHPRGWTGLVNCWPAGIAGFPAPAGMDLLRPRPDHWSAGIPRTRGDGP